MAAVGIRMTANNLTVNGVTYNGLVDLDNVFHPRGTATPAADTGIRSAGYDLSQYFYPKALAGSMLAQATGFRRATTDLREIFAARGSVSPGSPGGGCLPFGTRVPLWAGGSKLIEDIVPGDVVIGYYVEGMVDEDVSTWREWSAPKQAGLHGIFVPVTVRMTLHGNYPSYWRINNSLRPTFEHRFFVLRGDWWMWRQAQDLKVEDAFLSGNQELVAVETSEFVNEPIQIANIDVEPVDCFMIEAFNGEWILSHNPGDKG